MSAKPDISVIVPIGDRCGDLARLHREFGEALRRAGRTYEFLYVLDGRSRRRIEILQSIKQGSQEPVTVLVLGRAFGEAAALTVGAEKAAGDILITLAPYFQVGFDAVESVLRRLEQTRADLIIGRRHPRRDSWINRAQSWLFHRVVGTMTATRFTDISSGFRVMKRRVFDELQLYGDLHLFIPVLASHQGFEVVEQDMGQRDEDLRGRFFGFGAYPRRLLDILTVFFLIKFTRKPLRFFGLIGLSVLAVGLAICLYLLLYRFLGFGGIADRPLLLLGVLLMVLGVQSVSIGLLGEIIIFTHAREVREYEIAEIL